MTAGTILLTVIVVLLCLIPKPENDLFFEMRTGGDILRSHHLPHVDAYSWTNRGTRWDVPEWLAFVLWTLAFRAGAFFGTWLLMAALAVAAAWVVWFGLAPRVGAAWAFLLTNLMLLALSPTLQERPYAFTYVLLPVALWVLMQGRADRPRALLWLVPLCALWANLHQGVVAFLGLLLVYAVGDAVTAIWLRTHAGRLAKPRQALARARLMLATLAACAGAALCSPYGWGLYRNVLVTLDDHTLMANVTEWNPVTVLPLSQVQPFLLVAVLVFGALAFSRRRNLADALVLAVLFGEALLHARNIALFAIGGMVIGAAHFEAVVQDLQGHTEPVARHATRNALLAALALLYAVMIGVVGFANLRRGIGPDGYSAAGIGEAVARQPNYPSRACAFLVAEQFPPHLRLLNNFEIGGYLMWRLPRVPVFIDGRLDVYAGRTFRDMLTLARAGGSPAWADLVRRYDLDCVMTTSARQARAFAADPQWQLVYADTPNPSHQHCHILLRRRPEFAALIARCLRDRPLAQSGTP